MYSKQSDKKNLLFLGRALYYQKKYTEAIFYFSLLLSVFPHSYEGHCDIGVCYFRLNNLTYAKLHLEKSLHLSPDYPLAHWALSLTLLAIGEYHQAWEHYEWRLQCPQINYSHRHFESPRWNGDSYIDQTLLIYSEQGLGDTIQFLRFLPYVKLMGGTLLLEVQQPLYRLLQTGPWADAVFIRGEPLPKIDFHLPLLSLPYHLKIDTARIPNQSGYLTIEDLPSHTLSTTERALNIGFCWSGNPEQIDNELRSCCLDYFIQLSKDCSANWYSLQKPIQSEDLEKLQSENMVILQDYLTDLYDTAQFIQQLDLIITVDTAIAHLSGALNKPTWVLLAHHAAWQWQLHRKDSPWYESVRLFRQPTADDWSSIFDAVSQELLNKKSWRVSPPT